jgi:uncharacterized UPF0160 family protein
MEDYAYVIDVGGVYDEQNHLFDHHQSSYKGHFSSAGMVAAFLHKKGYYDDELYTFLRKELLDHIDAFDNGRVSREVLNTPTFSHVVENFVPVALDASKEQMNSAFFEALEFALGHFQRTVERFKYRVSCKKIVQQVMLQSKEILVFDSQIPWLENFFDLGGEQHPALFIVMPVPNGWKLRVVPKTYEERMGARKDLPKVWGGLSDQEFEKVSKIKGAKFCHKGLFISIFDSKEAALQAATFSVAN